MYLVVPNKRGGGQNKRGGGGWTFLSVMNEKRDINKYLILMLDLKVSKQTRSEASKNKVIIKRVSNISITKSK